MSLSVKIKKNLGEFKLDVEFEAGNEVLALLGASGCGKSMTLRCIAGVVKPDEGKIVLDGETLFDSEKKINLPPQRRHVGLLFQNYALFPNMTVEQNIRTVLARAGKSGDDREHLSQLMKSFYIDGLEDHYPAQLSGGQQQRVALARILASGPRIIMLDEPLSALDSFLRWQLERELMRMLETFPGTTLYVSHNRDEIYRICTKVCVINKGSSEPVCPVEKLFERPATLASALLSGCKNYSRAEPADNGRIKALDWQTELDCGKFDEGARWIGVRAHYIKPVAAAAENTVKCRVTRVTQDVFSTIIMLLPAGADEKRDFAHIRMELSKEAAASIKTGDELFVKIEAKDIMPLTK